MKSLNQKEIEQVSGDSWMVVARVIAPTVFNMLAYVCARHKQGDDITLQGLAIAGASGIIGGGVGVAAGAAAGGCMVVNSVWGPSSFAISTSGRLISFEH